ncbi:MAG TPA: hypothetical protein VNK50_10370 [Calidithermus sp.]|nr:hypothetical protein [Calidithermus sp.]
MEIDELIETRRRLDEVLRESEELLGRCVPAFLREYLALRGRAAAAEEEADGLRAEVQRLEAEVKRLRDEVEALTRDRDAIAAMTRASAEEISRMAREVLVRLGQNG